MKNILALLYTTLFMISCSSGFNPRYYYNKNKNENKQTIIQPDIEFDNDVILDPKEDPFITGEWNDPNYRFNMNFDDYVIEAKFNSKNQPTYKLIKKNAWQLSNPQMNEYKYNGPNTEAKGVTMENVIYYLYKSINPNFPGSKYNDSSRIKRFYFYRFTARAAGQDTDNYLIAIDTYSKLVFAFGIPTSWKKVAGIPAPTSWGSVELGWEANADDNSKIDFSVDGLKYFYEYDPVGIVKENGEIEIYDWCWDSIGRNRYAPRFNGDFGDTNRAIANYGKPGRSPYIPTQKELDNTPLYQMEVSVTGVAINNIDSRTANRYALDGAVGFDWVKGDIKDIYDYAQFSYRFKIATHTGMPNIETVLDKFPNIGAVGGFLGIGASRDDNNYKINVGSTKNIDVSKDYIVDYRESDDIYIDLYFEAIKYDEPVGNSTQLEWAYEYSIGNNIYIRLKYDKNTKRFVYDSYSDGYGNRMISVDKSFSLGLGEEKEIYIELDGQDGDDTPIVVKKWLLNSYNVGACGNNPTGYNNRVRLKFKLKFEDLGLKVVEN